MGGRMRMGTRTVAVALWGLLMVGANVEQPTPVRGDGAHGRSVAALALTQSRTVTASAAASTTVTATVETGGTPTSGLPTATAVSATVPSVTLSATSIASTTPSITTTATLTSTVAVSATATEVPGIGATVSATPTATPTIPLTTTTTPPTGIMPATSTPSVSATADLTATATPAISPSVPTSPTALLATPPLSFEANVGQTDSRVAFLARTANTTLFLTPGEAVLTLRAAPSEPPRRVGLDPLEDRIPLPTAPITAAVLRMSFGGATTPVVPVGLDPLPGTATYLTGNDPSRWHTGVPTYAQAAYRSVYPGIDLVYHGSARGLEYDWTLQPGADPAVIDLALSGVSTPRLDPQGNLVLRTATGDLLQSSPLAYQDIGGRRAAVDAHFVLTRPGHAGVAVGAHDPTQPLVIDPVLSYGTYLGGSSNAQAYGVAVDAAGNTYVSGGTSSVDFPTTTGAYSTTYAGGNDVFVSKLNPQGTSLVWSTYLGGSGNDVAMGGPRQGLAVDGAGNVYLAGGTTSTDFPTTANAYSRTYGGGSAYGGDAYVAKLNPQGAALLYSSYLGGSGADYANALAVDNAGHAYAAGNTSSPFPVTAGAFQTTLPVNSRSEGWVAELDTTRSGSASLVYGTYLAGSNGYSGNYGIAVDPAGDAYVAGDTNSGAFPVTAGAAQTTPGGGLCTEGGIANQACHDASVIALNPSGSGLLYGTYLGGSGDERAASIALDAANNAYVTGWTASGDFPVVNALQAHPGGNACAAPPCQHAFVTKLTASSSAFLYSTYLGGSNTDVGFGVAVDGTGTAYVTGYTYSSDFPITPNAPQTALPAGASDTFVTRIAADGRSVLYSTYLGGSGINSGDGIAVDSLGGAYVAGSTTSTTFPATGLYTSNTGGTAAFVAKIDPAPVAVTTVDDSVQGAGFNQFIYVGNWIHCTAPPSGPNCSPLYYNGTNSADNTTGDYATLQFSGSGIRYYATSDGNRGIAAVSIDGGPETLVDLYGPQQGNVLAYTSPPLANGTHILKVRVTGANNPASSNTYVTIDRVDITAPTTRVVAIASGSATGASPYSPDGYYSGGSTYATSNAVDTSGVSDPAPMSVYQSERYGNFSYVVPNLVPGTSYTVRLHFAEISLSGPGQRVFDVSINSQQVLANFDIYATVGANKAVVGAYDTTADGAGRITIAFTTIINNAKIDGIEVLANAAINSGGGIAGPFSPDTDYSVGSDTYANGNAIDTSGAVNPAPQGVYQSERSGNMAYVIPDLIPGLAYTVRLHFAEIYWNAVGQRVFDVAINGSTVLSRFDIIATTGSPNTAIVKEFPATADNNGQITITYTSDTDRAKSSGIEVLVQGQVPAPARCSPGDIVHTIGPNMYSIEPYPGFDPTTTSDDQLVCYGIASRPDSTAFRTQADYQTVMDNWTASVQGLTYAVPVVTSSNSSSFGPLAPDANQPAPGPTPVNSNSKVVIRTFNYWAGYAKTQKLTGYSYSRAESTWTITSAMNKTLIWVGLGGLDYAPGCQTRPGALSGNAPAGVCILQAGTDIADPGFPASGGKPFFWFENYPDNTIQQVTTQQASNNPPPKLGDSVDIRARYAGPGSAEYSFHNISQRYYFNLFEGAQDPVINSAECVVEQGFDHPFDKYTAVPFTHCRTRYTNGNLADPTGKSNGNPYIGTVNDPGKVTDLYGYVGSPHQSLDTMSGSFTVSCMQRSATPVPSGSSYGGGYPCIDQ